MTYTVEQVVAGYITYRDQVAEISKRHAEELAPFRDAMDKMEAWLMEKMNQDGVESYRTGSGTPYKATHTSIKLEDPEAFKAFLLGPAQEALVKYFQSSGYVLNGSDHQHILTLLQQAIRWDLADLRAGKKGIQELAEATGQLPPGVGMSQFAKINIRGS